jgi:phosphate transport system permease protein
MTAATFDTALPIAARPPRRDIGIKKRYAAEARFKAYGIAAITFGLVFLAIMLGTIVTKGYTAFWQTNVTLPVTFDSRSLIPQNKRASDPSVLIKANYDKLAQNALIAKLGIDPAEKAGDRQAQGLPVRQRPHPVARCVMAADPSLIGKTVDVSMLASANIDSAFKGQIDLSVPEAAAR